LLPSFTINAIGAALTLFPMRNELNRAKLIISFFMASPSLFDKFRFHKLFIKVEFFQQKRNPSKSFANLLTTI
jgi:hypothetical protein